MTKLKFFDEAGSSLAMTGEDGRAAKDERVIANVPQNYGSNAGRLASLSLAGSSALMTLLGAVDGDVFKVYVEQVLCPSPEAGEIVVMDIYLLVK